MPKKGVGKIDPSVSYRILEEQEKYVRNLYREKLRKNAKTTPSQEMRYLLELGIQMHREGRREKFEMSGYFRSELRTFTSNFFKENNENYISRLSAVGSNVRLIVLVLRECLKMLYTINLSIRALVSDDEDPRAQSEILAEAERKAETAVERFVNVAEGKIRDDF